MLANGTNPPKIMPYLGDCYDSLCNLKYITGEDGVQSTKTVDCMIAKDREEVMLSAEFTMEGEVENYLNKLTDVMVTTLKEILNHAIETAVNWEVEVPREKWLFLYPAQIVLTGTQIYWTEEAEKSLEEYEGGQEDAVKKYLNTCNVRLDKLIELVRGSLSSSDRCKIISLITLDVHARDVIQKLVDTKTEGPAAFLWQQQLRFYWAPSGKDVDIKICDYRCKYFYEWIGNTGRLVITPLTDRCYITLTTALRLMLGGAPAGPAGTGKTETVKDLAKGLAIPCYVINCSDQMNYKTLAQIFMGLSQSGFWGCFDEFNRISIEVLSVVSSQVKNVLDALIVYKQTAGVKNTFIFMNAETAEDIPIKNTVGFFITMNPGYAGRTELPENPKA
jgi:dynein heavy chain